MAEMTDAEIIAELKPMCYDIELLQTKENKLFGKRIKL